MSECMRAIIQPNAHAITRKGSDAYAVSDTWSSCGSIPSRSGTTACVVLLRRGRLWTANCGDSTCVLGIRVGGLCSFDSSIVNLFNSDLEGRSWYPAGIRATSPHSLNARERARVARDGGQVAMDSRGDPRVVFTWCDRHCWARQSRCSHRKSHYPCLNIARSLGDFWSFSSETGRFAVSCDPDIRSFSIADDNIFACCLHSDGVALSPAAIMKTINASAFEDKENIFEERARNHAMEVIIQNRHYLRSRPYRDNAAAVAVSIFFVLGTSAEVKAINAGCNQRLIANSPVYLLSAGG
ncbi:hypothetical protein ANCDUO_03330 [Ancylostoma duodenale]|uniref:PPM-type phosphatase domain-containing protein n=1 Tax=Ancylostoma duodenale TaxID=51022 RepID=A0A0C2D9C5_9BILA|nr:hypothetical protein ANCDUO_03330 [Ancylostoma duodenale]